ncbi:DNA replication/repair protein RecF [Haloimpatiens lingqiaonensis]|uniref:DNA replication/repair protein RecF n=1 Tax=Haloimpatiens lingqiaonensis TaxID=1380675 RepID=UPI0010FD5C54|nr:DNA replication/repair protein RecF [Haloimpatiens lingqiaonensis]
MYVKGLQLINFRNYNNLLMEFKQGVNVLVGDNAQGKTNILESIYYCSLAKSHRTNRDRELINWDYKNAYISLSVGRERLDKKIDIKIFKEGKKGINVNSIKVNKIADLIGIFNVVMFSPEDLDIVKGSPAARRRLLDIELCKLSKKYYYNLSVYKKALGERNSLLKGMRCDEGILEVYDTQLSSFGAYLIKERLKYIEKLNEYGKIIHSNITSGNEEISFNYVSQIKNLQNTENIEEALFYLLKSHRKSDMEKRNTSVGPHRDDFDIKINDIDAREYGSQGQQRTSVLTIKFASLDIIKSITGEYPVLLLDDVLSELDIRRQKYILSSIKDIQTIITCTGMHNIQEYLGEDSLVYEVKSGSIERIR